MDTTDLVDLHMHWTAADLRAVLGIDVADSVTGQEFEDPRSRSVFLLSDGRWFVRNPDYPTRSRTVWVDSRDHVAQTEATA